MNKTKAQLIKENEQLKVNVEKLKKHLELSRTLATGRGILLQELQARLWDGAIDGGALDTAVSQGGKHVT